MVLNVPEWQHQLHHLLDCRYYCLRQIILLQIQGCHSVLWENDGLRDQPDNREAHFTIFKESLLQNNKPFDWFSLDFISASLFAMVPSFT